MLFKSKLPDVGTTIFTIMSRRAQEEGALNIGQGFPDYPVDPLLAELIGEAVREGHNQYAPMEGSHALREQIAIKLHRTHGCKVDPVREVTITCGATEALFDAIQTVIGPGDEAVIFDPAYDSYEPAVRLAGGRCIRIPMQPPDFAYDWDRVRAALTPRTRLIIINSPQNPSCTIARRADLDRLATVIRDRPISVLSDEVYEHVVYDGEAHASVLAHPELRERSFAVYSFGKTLHATGWRTGYCVATPALTTELRKVHQFNTFSIAAPLQEAIARYLARAPQAWTGLSAYFQARRDLLMRELQGSGFEILRPQGSYFLLLDYGRLDRSDDLHFCDRLIREAKVASIPLSVFYAQPPAMHLVRLCVAKREETLLEAARRLREFSLRIG